MAHSVYAGKILQVSENLCTDFSVCTHTYRAELTEPNNLWGNFRKRIPFSKMPHVIFTEGGTIPGYGQESDLPHTGHCSSNAHSLGHCPALLVITRIKFGSASCTLSQNQLQKLTVN